VGDSDRWRLFGDDNRYLDRFGLLLVLTSISVAVLSLIDLDDPNESLRSELGWLMVSFSVGFSLLVALRASGVTRRWQRVANVFIGVALVAAVLSAIFIQFSDVAVLPGIGRPSFVWVVIALVSPVVVLRRVLSHQTVTIETLWGAMSVYLLMAIAYNYMFLEVQRFGSVPFFGLEETTSSFMYFSVVTITTLGYGDLSPVSDIGRFFAITEAIIGQVFLVTIVARLVSLLSRSSVSSKS
jgi:hypothetical protein